MQESTVTGLLPEGDESLFSGASRNPTYYRECLERTPVDPLRLYRVLGSNLTAVLDRLGLCDYRVNKAALREPWKVEVDLARGITNAFNKNARKAIERSTEILKTWPDKMFDGTAPLYVLDAKIDDMVLGLRESFEMPIGQAADIATVVSSLYTTARSMVQNGLKVTTAFSVVDTATVRALSAQTTYWVGTLYDKQLSHRVRAVASEVVRTGAGRTAGGKLLHQGLREHFGLKENTGLVPIPSSYRGSPKQYFEGLSAAARARSQATAAVETFSQLKLRSYAISAVMDERTSKICQFMDGRTFTIEHGKLQTARLLAVESPEDVKLVAPWVTAETAKEFVNEKDDEPSQADDLAKAGLALPPYHYLCRTEVVLSEEAREQITA